MARRAEPFLLTATACRSRASGRGGIWCRYALANGKRGRMTLTKALVFLSSQAICSSRLSSLSLGAKSTTI